MALIKCKECDSEVSSKADTCPKCGAKVKKKTGCGSMILLFFVVIVVFGIILSSLSDGPSLNSSSQVDNNTNQSTYTPPPPRAKTTREIKNEILEQLELEWSWKKTGFDNIMEADFTITNNSTYDIKDIRIRTLQFAKSGTQIDRNTRTIYEIITGGETKRFDDFNMGFIHSQSNSATASITDFTLIE